MDLTARGKRVIAVDADPRLGALANPRIEYHVADMRALPFLAPASVDAVASISVLEHLDEVARLDALREWARVLRPGTQVVLTFDYPTVEFEGLFRAFREVDLHVVGEVSTVRGSDALRFQPPPGSPLYVWRRPVTCSLRSSISSVFNSVVEVRFLPAARVTDRDFATFLAAPPNSPLSATIT